MEMADQTTSRDFLSILFAVSVALSLWVPLENSESGRADRAEVAMHSLMDLDTVRFALRLSRSVFLDGIGPRPFRFETFHQHIHLRVALRD
jgi:hypothetical protein